MVKFFENSYLKAVLILFLCLIFLASAYFISIFIYDYAVDNIDYFVKDAPRVGEFVDNKGLHDLEDFPIIKLGEEYGSLTIKDADVKDVPIYFGDMDEILIKGVGHFNGSRFPGQGGKIVYSGHVTTIFKKLETLKPGAIVEVKTKKFGNFKYKMTKSVIFNYTEYDYVFPEEVEKEELFIYTCYPLNNNGKLRTDRIGIRCDKIEGDSWVNTEILEDKSYGYIH